MIKNILVAIDGSEHSRAATEHALSARRATSRDASSALHVVDIVSIEGSFLHDISGSLGFEPYLDFSSKMREVAAGARARDARRVLRAGGRSERTLRDACWTIGVDRQRDLRARAHGRSRRHRPSRRQREVLDRAARRHRGERDAQVSEAPAVCPTDWKFGPIATPLLAYDGSQRAAPRHAGGGRVLRYRCRYRSPCCTSRATKRSGARVLERSEALPRVLLARVARSPA